MKVLADTNIILDIVLERSPFFTQSAQALNRALEVGINVYITATTITDLYYIVRKAKGRGLALDFIKELLDFVEIAAVDKSVIVQALQLDLTDFEDAVQVSAANNTAVDMIITRNEADFTASNLAVHTPETFLTFVAGR